MASSPVITRARSLLLGFVLGLGVVSLSGQATITPAMPVNGAGVFIGTSITLPTVTFATLPTAANGMITYCSDCTETTAATCPVTQASCICAGAGSGAFARRANGVWYCTFPP